MDCLEAIKTRRSCRNYLEKTVERDKLHRILEAASYAPSPVNKQPWEFVVVINVLCKKQFFAAAEATRLKLAEKSGWKWLSAFNIAFLSEAPVLVAVLGDPAKNGAEQFLDEPGNGYIEACSCAVQNMLLAAHAEGLGSLWYSLFEQKDAREIFGLPADKVAIGVVCLGYAEREASAPRRKSVEEMTRFID